MIRAIVFVLICWIGLASEGATEVVMRNREGESGACKIEIRNTHEILDIRNSCKTESLSKQIDNWSVLIPSNTSYKIVRSEHTWKGYRYFKNPQHYKYTKYNFTLYNEVVESIINSQSIKLASIFNQDYSINLFYNDQSSKWQLSSIKIQYSGNAPEQIKAQGSNLNISTTRIEGSNNQNSFASRKLEGSGLHQTVNLTIDLDVATNLNLDQTCSIFIEEILPQSTYIDVDQLRSVEHYEVINVEKPEHASQQYYFKYRVPISKFLKLSAKKYSYKYPIHFRYPEPSHLNFTTVPLHPSEQITLYCSNKTVAIIPEDPFVTRGSARIFNGSSHDTKIVSMITFILTIVASMVLVRQLRKI